MLYFIRTHAQDRRGACRLRLKGRRAATPTARASCQDSPGRQEQSDICTYIYMCIYVLNLCSMYVCIRKGLFWQEMLSGSLMACMCVCTLSHAYYFEQSRTHFSPNILVGQAMVCPSEHLARGTGPAASLCHDYR
jgi:hypothetical protein